MRTLPTWLGALFALSLLTSTTSSSAQTQSSANDFPHFKTFIGADSSFWSSRPFGSTVSLVPMVEGKLGARSSLTFQLPLAFASDNDTSAAPGNPSLSVQFLLVNEGRTRFYLGGATAFPLLPLADDDGLSSVAARANVATTYQTLPQWVNRHFFLGVLAGLEHKFDAPLFLRFQIDPFVALPLTKNAGGGFFYLRTKFEIEGRGSSGLGGGMALSGVVNSLANDTFQSAVDGFISYYRPSVFLRGGLLLALDNPLGFGFDRGKVATLHFSLGIPLD